MKRWKEWTVIALWVLVGVVLVNVVLPMVIGAWIGAARAILTYRGQM